MFYLSCGNYTKDLLTNFNTILKNDKGRIFESTLQKVISLAEKIKSYNLNDSNFEEIAALLEKSYKGIENVDLKNEKERQETQQKTEKILQKINGYL
jgi:uncharacterized protein with ParB-like and HNH nuclease domain